jgi:hypothetical protein
MPNPEFATIPLALRTDPGVEYDKAKFDCALSKWKRLVSDLHPAFFAIENDLEHCLVDLFSATEQNRASFLLTHLIRSSHLSLESKRKLVLSWAEHAGKMQASEKSKIEKLFKTVIRKRNAVVHGAPVCDVNYRLRIEYFSGDPFKFEISSKWVGETASECLQLSDWLQKLHREN